MTEDAKKKEDNLKLSRIRFKNAKDVSRVNQLKEPAKIVLLSLYDYCLDKNIPLTVTETVTTLAEDEALKRVSNTHRTGRAFDISVIGWTESEILACCAYFNARYASLAATVNGAPVLAVYEKNAAGGRHIHFQINARYA